MSAPAMSSVDAHLEMEPEDAIVFPLSLVTGVVPTTPGGTVTDAATPRVTLTLRHPDPDSPPVAFKVKTTQPRRYLVRPNQGLIAPGGTEVVQILLVEKDTKQLIASYQQLGVAALEHCKDKFLVQSVAVSSTQAKDLVEYEQLTAFWAATGAGTTQAAVVNKKLHVRHVVVGDEADIDATNPKAASATPPVASTSTLAPATMTKEQLIPELTGLRRKYDELVAFSVNLTAERDMLSNTLEQTKRDLNRAVNATSRTATATSPAAKSAVNNRAVKPRSSGLVSVMLMLLWTVLCLGFGLWTQPYVAKYQPQVSLLTELLGFTSPPPAPRRIVKKDQEL